MQNTGKIVNTISGAMHKLRKLLPLKIVIIKTLSMPLTQDQNFYNVPNTQTYPMHTFASNVGKTKKIQHNPDFCGMQPLAQQLRKAMRLVGNNKQQIFINSYAVSNVLVIMFLGGKSSSISPSLNCKNTRAI